ncbi:hypothetical protein [Haloarchaeobius sp. FL176]|uniref:hypothetical protein n=1 Tax=Haloarchaeobius sp. FL176 TaxID=2967129 RepID=UPI0021490D75|nr:hypothetical protein [Haloarchaeobius sp. FL176]
MGTLELVAFDIETTGFNVTDKVTAIGFAMPIGVRAFVQTGGVTAPDVEQAVQGRVEQHVQVSVHASKAALLDAVGVFARERLHGEDVLLVAFNGERWKDGFDLPFLRTRLAATDVEWPLRDMPYADLLPVVTRRFNVTVDGEDQSTLPGAYEVLVDGDLNDRDPFDDSAAAVTAFAEGQYADLVTHNVVDVLRTGELGAVTRRYCSKSDYSLKSLTPTIHDT